MAAVKVKETCQLCEQLVDSRVRGQQQPVRKKMVKSVNHLCGYFYQQNVPIAESEHLNNYGLPKLNFNFSMGGGRAKEAGGPLVIMCEQCYVMFEKLEQLHKELELVKKSIEFQVSTINGQVCVGGKVGGAIMAKIMGGYQSFDMSLTGTTVGKGNISKVLSFIGNLCDNSEEKASIPEPEPPEELVLPPLLNPPGPVLEEEYFVKVEPAGDNLEDEGDDPLAFEEEESEGKEEDVEVEEEDDEDYKPEVDAPSSTSSGTQQVRTFKRTVPADPRPFRRQCQPRRDLRAPQPAHHQQCKICGKILSKTSSMTNHLRTHTGDRPFECPFCEVRFNQVGSLRRHKRKKHGTMIPPVEKQRPPTSVTTQRRQSRNERNAEKFLNRIGSGTAGVVDVKCNQALLQMIRNDSSKVS